MAKQNPAARSKKTETAKKAKRLTLPKGVKKAFKWVKVPKFLRRFGGYFVGSFRELQQVKWPTRKVTLQLTGAVIVFTIVMTLIISLLDLGFEQLVKKVLL